jgi:hypothetical protein
MSVWPPSDENDHEFARVYAQDVCARRPLYVVERTLRGGTYRFFADFDLLNSSSSSSSQVEATVRSALGQLPDALRRGTVTVCVRKGHGSNPQKQGAHLIWDDSVRVTDLEAREIRDAWVRLLLLEQQQQQQDWASIIDPAVYRNNGLRMPWSLKCVDAESHYEPAFECDLSRPDVALRALSPDPEDLDSVSDLVRRCSLRARPSATGAAAAAAAATVAADAAIAADAAVAAMSSSIEAVVSAYWDPSVASSLKRVDAGLFSCSSRRCYIKGGEHRGNHIFFRVRPSVNRGYVDLIQYCHSPKCSAHLAKIASIPKPPFF